MLPSRGDEFRWWWPSRSMLPAAAASMSKKRPSPRAPTTLMVVMCWLGAFDCEVAQAIGTCPPGHRVKAGSGSCHCWPANVTTCCDESARQAVQACLEYARLGFSELSCQAWKQTAISSCHQSCGNCTVMAAAVKDICTFSLQILNDGQITKKYCGETHDAFLNYRCGIGCKYNATNCTGDNGNPEGDMCMSTCGNYAKCNCRHQKGTKRPDVCTGETVLYGPKPDPLSETGLSSMNHSCADTPIKCRNHIPEGAVCNKYRLCKPDMCFIQAIECPPLDQCTLEGFCEKSEGLCFYKDKPDGEPCNDQLHYTVDDSCQRGVCTGTIDNCLRYNVTCPVYGECTLGGTCQPATGRCSYNFKPNDDSCSDGREYTVEDRCYHGFCRGRAVDLCVEQGIDCTTKVPNTCNDAGICDPRTGVCSLPVPVSNRSCDDNDTTTVNDTCIDGLCVGYASADWSSQRFVTLGNGRCADRAGRSMASYSGDADSEKACEEFCRDDRQCLAFSYSPPVCSIYGSIRTKAPDDGNDWSFQGGTVPIAVVIERAESVEGQRESVCRKKDEYGDTVLDQSEGKMQSSKIFAPMVLMVFFFTMLCIFCVGPIFRCFRVCICGVPKKMKEARKMEENMIFVQNKQNMVSWAEGSGDEQDLRKVGQAQIGQAPDQPLPLEAGEPDAPSTPPHQLGLLPGELPPDSASPQPASETLSPMSLPPGPYADGEQPPAIRDDVSSQPDPSPKKKGAWSRPKKKEAWNKRPADERSPAAKNDAERLGKGPNVSPAGMAGGAGVFM